MQICSYVSPEISLRLGTAVAHIFTDASDIEAVERAIGARLVTPVQTHSLNVAEADASTCSHELADTDALITLTRGIAIGIRTADCVPLLISAPDIGAVAAIHSGWRGTIGRISARAADALTAHGADPAMMQAYIGPSICGRCYEVSEELALRFRSEGMADAVAECRQGNPHIDLQAACLGTLLDSGLKADNIACSNLCTLHAAYPDGHHPWPSWRREPQTQRRLLSVIMMPLA